MVLMPTKPCLAYFTLPLVAGSKIRPTSLRVLNLAIEIQLFIQKSRLLL